MSNVQSVERAFAVLRCLAAGSAGVSDVAERAHLPKSTVSRLLATLGEVGAVEQLADGTYRVGDAMADIAAGATPGRHLVAVARPSLTELVATIGEDAGLSVLDGSDVYYLDQVARRRLGGASRLDRRAGAGALRVVGTGAARPPVAGHSRAPRSRGRSSG